MPQDKIYVPKSSGREIQFQNGGSMLKLSFDSNMLMEFIRQHASNGWITLNVHRRKEPSEKGATHYIVLDTWKPKPRQPDADQPELPKAEPEPESEDDDVPF